MAKKDEGEKGGLEHEAKGKTEGYTPKDVPVMKEADDEKDSFNKGGKVKKRAKGGRAEGKMPHKRLDKKAGGGHMKRASGGRMSGGHSPLTMAANVKGRPGGDYSDSVDKEDD
jgi:hypothetical protein